MSLVFRIVLIVASIISLLYMMRKIHQSKLQIEHALFWIVFSFIVVILALFPGIAIQLAAWLGILSPVNLVYLIIIFVLIVKLFQVTLQISKLENKIKNLTQHEALDDFDDSTEKPNND